MRRLFADTAFYVALLNERDALHEQASILASTTFQIVTTEYVLLEVGNSFNRSHARTQFPGLVKALYANPNIEVVAGSKAMLEHALALFAGYDDKHWSLTDCSSFVVMREFGLTEALTSDHHFEQAGFKPLLSI